ncbi:hydroxycarboxylic acid receptor 2-like [Eucyclogobius newberryi]|uniref:hydroxycarboxylic acid receptor 2-like n=1 Tax=Eucyclogobius newberryi TaxID=166745 RepID=UPI003B59A4E1
MPPVQGVEFILGAVGNGFALWIFCFHLKPWKSSTVLLFSLALVNALLLVTLPFRISYYISNLDWKFGNTFCSICQFLVGINRCGNKVFPVTIALDRYMRVVHPHHPVNSMRVSRAACAAAVLWLLTVVMSGVLTPDKKKQGYCGDFSSQCERNKSWHRLGFQVVFWVSFLVILFCTLSINQRLRRRRIAQQTQVKNALLAMKAIVVLFVVCFLPSKITQLVIWVKASSMATTDQRTACAEMGFLTIAYSLTMSLVYLDSVIAPVLYFSSSDFRSSLRGALGLQPSLDSAEPEEESVSGPNDA